MTNVDPLERFKAETEKISDAEGEILRKLVEDLHNNTKNFPLFYESVLTSQVMRLSILTDIGIGFFKISPKQVERIIDSAENNAISGIDQFKEIELLKAKIDSALKQGNKKLARAYQHNLKILKQKMR